MCSFKFENIDDLNSEDLAKGSYLWIWYADKIPPHIGFSIDGNYYSLKYNGKDFGLKYDKALHVIHSRRIPSLFIKINGLISKQDVIERYGAYSSAKVEKATCLTPLNFLFGFPDCAQLSELLGCLQGENLIQQVAGMYLPLDYKGIPKYGIDEIQNRLRTLEDAKIN
ncbi:MAG: hypothetical protein ACK50Y_05595 [Flavobacteriia bacterium]